MPFNLLNISTSFQGYINKILTKKLEFFVIVYLDGIFIYYINHGNLEHTVIQH